MIHAILAHGFGGRVDLPVPQWLFVYGAATVVVISFVALAALWPEPRFQSPAAGEPGRKEPPAPGGMPATEWIVRGMSLAVFLLVLSAAMFGETVSELNLAPVFVYIWFWVGLAILHALLGNLWATLSPFDTIARLIGLDEGRREYPRALGRWPAAILLLGFVWMELVYPDGARPPVLAAAILVYTAITLGGMWLYGRRAWNENGEAFAVYFELLSRIAPLRRDGSSRIAGRVPLSALPGVPPRPGLVAFLMVLIGSTSFDGFSRTSLWLDWLGGSTGIARMLASTTGLVGMVLLVAAVYAAAMAAAGAASGRRWHPLAVRFAHTLVPIALAYALAHYVSLLLLEGQAGVARLSDPFGFGWDVFGTATWAVNFSLISATTIWYLQVAAIVAGHVGGVILAHDRAVAEFAEGKAVRTQYALLAVMVAFTAGGLLILSGG